MTYKQGYQDALKAAAAVCVEEGDQQKKAFDDYVSTGGKGPATCYANLYFKMAENILALPIPDHTSDIPVSKGEPEAWLFKARTKQPNVRLEVWSSVDETAHWPVDQWDEIKIEPLFTAPPQVEAAVEDFRRRAIESVTRLKILGSSQHHIESYNIALQTVKNSIESQPAFETKD